MLSELQPSECEPNHSEIATYFLTARVILSGAAVARSAAATESKLRRPHGVSEARAVREIPSEAEGARIPTSSEKRGYICRLDGPSFHPVSALQHA